MKNLLKKEILLCTNAQIVIFSLFALFILIPSWPPAIAFIYPLSGVMTLFPRGLANKDIEYTSLLPVKKTDIVKGKTLFIMVVELAVILLATAGGIIRALYPIIPDASESDYYIKTQPTISLLGFAFFAFGVMNFIMISMYYKNPYKRLSAPSLISIFASTFVLGIGTVLIVLVDVMRDYSPLGLMVQFITLAIGMILFVVLSLLGYLLGAKRFEKVDLQAIRNIYGIQMEV